MFSRLAHHDQKTLIRSTLLYTGAGIAVILGFLFLILPLFIRILAYKNLGSGTSASTEISLSTRPTLRAPYSATSSATVTLTGTAQAQQKIILLVGGIAEHETVALEDGSFIFTDITLVSGENSFSAVSEDKNGERSNPSSVVTVSLIADAPTLEIQAPTNGTVFTKRKENPIPVRGKTEPNNRVFLNDRLQFVGSDGSFTGNVQLTQGKNTIIVKVVNPAAVETIQEISVEFAP